MLRIWVPHRPHPVFPAPQALGDPLPCCPPQPRWVGGGGAAQGTRRGDKEESMSVTEIKKS